MSIWRDRIDRCHIRLAQAACRSFELLIPADAKGLLNPGKQVLYRLVDHSSQRRVRFHRILHFVDQLIKFRIIDQLIAEMGKQNSFQKDAKCLLASLGVVSSDAADFLLDNQIEILRARTSTSGRLVERVSRFRRIDFDAGSKLRSNHRNELPDIGWRREFDDRLPQGEVMAEGSQFSRIRCNAVFRLDSNCSKIKGQEKMIGKNIFSKKVANSLTNQKIAGYIVHEPRVRSKLPRLMR